MLKLINTAVCAALEASINKLLALDSVSGEKLASLSGTVIAIECTAPEIKIFISIRNKDIYLSSYHEGNVDTRIIGQAQSLLKLLTTKDNSHSFHAQGLEVQGSLEKLQVLQKILLSLHIDWEYHLSKFIGDIPTQTFSDSVSAAGNFAKNTHASLLLDIDEYVHEEKRLFPSGVELEKFYSAIDSLRLRLDRAQARLSNLTN